MLSHVFIDKDVEASIFVTEVVYVADLGFKSLMSPWETSLKYQFITRLDCMISGLLDTG
jgi:hypothetical protein